MECKLPENSGLASCSQPYCPLPTAGPGLSRHSINTYSRNECAQSRMLTAGPESRQPQITEWENDFGNWGAVIKAREGPAPPGWRGAMQAYNLVDLFKTLALSADPILPSSRSFIFSCHPRLPGYQKLSSPSPSGAAVPASIFDPLPPQQLPGPFGECVLRLVPGGGTQKHLKPSKSASCPHTTDQL